MFKIHCDKCGTETEVKWTQMFVGWLKDNRSLTIEAGKVTMVDKHHGEYLEMLGHGSLPLPEGWVQKWPAEEEIESRYSSKELCPECTGGVQND